MKTGESHPPHARCVTGWWWHGGCSLRQCAVPQVWYECTSISKYHNVHAMITNSLRIAKQAGDGQPRKGDRRQFAFALSQAKGSTGVPSRCTSRCRCAPVECPVLPTWPSSWVTVTCWPTTTLMDPAIMCAYRLCTF